MSDIKPEEPLVFEVGYNKGCANNIGFLGRLITSIILAPIFSLFIIACCLVFIRLFALTYKDLSIFRLDMIVVGSVNIVSWGIIGCFHACMTLIPHLAMTFLGLPIIFFLQKQNFNKWYFYLFAGFFIGIFLFTTIAVIEGSFFTTYNLQSLYDYLVPSFLTAIITWFIMNYKAERNPENA